MTFALFASVSLSLLPTLGRLSRVAQSEDAVASQAFCTSRGLAWRSVEIAAIGAASADAVLDDLVDGAKSDRDAGDGPNGGRESDDDCGYCTLTATTVLPAFHASVAPPAPAMACVCTRFAVSAIPRPAIYDRSPRGPPAPIAA